MDGTPPREKNSLMFGRSKYGRQVDPSLFNSVEDSLKVYGQRDK